MFLGARATWFSYLQLVKKCAADNGPSSLDIPIRKPVILNESKFSKVINRGQPVFEERVSRAKYARHNIKQIQKRKPTMCACATRAKETRRIYVRTKRESNDNYQRFFFRYIVLEWIND